MGSIWCSETSVATHQRCVTSQMREDLIYIAAETWSHAVKCLEDGTNGLFRNVGKYQFTLSNIPEERKSHLHRSGNLKSESHLFMYLFIGNLFTDAVSNPEWMPSSNWWRCVTNWKDCGRRQSWLYLRYHPVIRLEILKKTTQTLRIAVCWSEFEVGTYQMQVRCVYCWAVLFSDRIWETDRSSDGKKEILPFM